MIRVLNKYFVRLTYLKNLSYLPWLIRFPLPQLWRGIEGYREAFDVVYSSLPASVRPVTDSNHWTRVLTHQKFPDTAIFAFVFAEHFGRYPNLSKVAAHSIAEQRTTTVQLYILLLRASQHLDTPARSLLSLVRPSSPLQISSQSSSACRQASFPVGKTSSSSRDRKPRRAGWQSSAGTRAARRRKSCGTGPPVGMTSRQQPTRRSTGTAG